MRGRWFWTRHSEAVNLPIMLRDYANMIRDLSIEDSRDGLFGGTTLVRREPIGVVAAIVPWNVPQTVLSFKLAPALVAGRCIVIKPPPKTVLDAFLPAEILDQVGLPPGVVSILPGGPDLGRLLDQPPRRGHGRLHRAQRRLTANLESLFAATMIGNGEVCYLSTRVLAPETTTGRPWTPSPTWPPGPQSEIR